MLTGENGILNRTKQAKKENEIATLIEEIKLATMDTQTQINDKENTNYQKDFYTVLQNTLKKQDSSSYITDISDTTKEIHYKKHIFEMTSNNVIHSSKCTCQTRRDY